MPLLHRAFEPQGFKSQGSIIIGDAIREKRTLKTKHHGSPKQNHTKYNALISFHTTPDIELTLYV